MPPNPLYLTPRQVRIGAGIPFDLAKSDPITGRAATTALFASRPPRGCAARPLDKKAGAVLGGGGYLGSLNFGYLQRASSLFGTGISPTVSSPGSRSAAPRSICATGDGMQRLNRVLSKTFKLAFAGESNIRLANMADVDHLAARLEGIDFVFLGTVNQLSRRPVTLGTFETTPNDMTWEFYLDEVKVLSEDDDDDDEGINLQLSIFENSLRACRDEGVGHVVVFETPGTPPSERKRFASLIDGSGLSFTYLYTPLGTRWVNSRDYTFEKGVIDQDLALTSATLAKQYREKGGYEDGDWADDLPTGGMVGKPRKKEPPTIYREDLAAIAVQSILSLDCSRSRCIEVASRGVQMVETPGAMTSSSLRSSRLVRTDREWCVNSNVLAEMLVPVE